MRNKMRVAMSTVLVLIFALSFVASMHTATAAKGPPTDPLCDGISCCRYTIICPNGSVKHGFGEYLDPHSPTCTPTAMSRICCGPVAFCNIR